MAIESKFIQAKDVDTSEFLQVQATLTDRSGNKREGHTPTLVDDDIQLIEFNDSRFYPLQIKVQ